MNIADLVKATGRKREFDFFSKVAYICDNFGEDINVNKVHKPTYHYPLAPTPGHNFNYLQHLVDFDLVIIVEGATFFNYFLNEKDYSSRQFNPVVPERWEKMVEEILEKHKK